MHHPCGELRKEHFRQQDRMFKGPEGSKVWAYHGKSMRDLNWETNITS